jgi:hypothetical protein
MPLLDHFHTPLYPHRAGESFHSRLANCIADELHRDQIGLSRAARWNRRFSGAGGKTE